MKKVRIDLKMWALGVTLAVSWLCLIACSNGFNQLANDYVDSVTVRQEVSYSVDDADYAEKEMLADLYLVGSDMTLCLFAPQAESYEWNIYKIKETYIENGYGFTNINYEALDIPGYIPLWAKQLYMYIPDVEDLLPPGTYKIELKVTNKEGKVLTDSAALVIYKSFYRVN